jgi:hypothetical protein
MKNTICQYWAYDFSIYNKNTDRFWRSVFLLSLNDALHVHGHLCCDNDVQGERLQE